jgi:1,3-beta-glucan synthase
VLLGFLDAQAGGPVVLPTSNNMKAMQKQLNQIQRIPQKLPMTTITERMLASTEKGNDGQAQGQGKQTLSSVAERLLGKQQVRGAARLAAAAWRHAGCGMSPSLALCWAGLLAC